MHILLLQEVLLLLKKTFTANDFEDPNNTVAYANATNTENNNAFGEKKLVFKNNAPFINCISKINGVKIDNAEDLDVVMPMYNLLEYSKNYRKTTGSLWNYYRDDPNNPPTDNYNADPLTNSESFKYKSSITGKTSNANQENGENTEQENTKTKKILKLLFH